MGSPTVGLIVPWVPPGTIRPVTESLAGSVISATTAVGPVTEVTWPTSPSLLITGSLTRIFLLSCRSLMLQADITSLLRDRHKSAEPDFTVRTQLELMQMATSPE